MAGQGWAAPRIAAKLDDGTIPETIRAMLKKAGLNRRQGEAIPVYVGPHEYRLLQERAVAEGLSPDDWLTKLAIAAIRDDLFRAVVDDGAN